MRDERDHLSTGESGEFVLATYREIATHFRLGGPNAARTKAKRAGWTAEPTNHPADPLHIRVPRDAWSQAELRPPLFHGPIGRISRGEREPPSLDRDAASQTPDTPHIRALERHIATLCEDLESERVRRMVAEQQRDQALGELRAERERATVETTRLQAAADAAATDFRSERARAERAEQGRDAERTRAGAFREQRDAVQAQLAAAEAEAKAAHDRAWASGEQQAAAERRAAVERERAERAESRAVHERQDFLDAEARTRHELEAVRQRAEAAEQTVEHASREAQEAQYAAEALRHADAARKARGLLARLKAAWRGE